MRTTKKATHARKRTGHSPTGNRLTAIITRETIQALVFVLLLVGAFFAGSTVAS